ncbi:heme peroxidase [Ceratobasidium sp. AG-Ba]|nr:heme peroxidase [Ceratobasidium sp. AG-Ba]QRW09810.1 heme peroxidase [Ceratobasidium sp. AG-Ba]
MPLANDLAAIPGLIDAVENKGSIDDRKLLLEHALVFMSNLPPDNPIRQKGQGAVISMLYNDLPHPPASFIGDQYRFRAPDGGGNNTEEPDLGRAGTPYSRSVPQVHPLPLNELPDAGLLFDCLLKREKFEPHPAGLSSMFFAFATIVIHTIFRTNHKDVGINETSSYLDLSPLYGNSQKDQDEIRRWDGTGRLWDDVFSEDRLLLMPPAACTILVLFNRNHNFVARKLYLINEAGTFKDPDTLTDEQKRAQDHVLFNTARLINVGFFISVVLGDYLRTGLGLIKEASDFALEPFMDVPQSNDTHLARGQGNSVSVEFNILYHWHSALSKTDEKWTQDIFHRIFGDKKPEDITIEEFTRKAYEATRAEKDKKKWTFGGLERQDGRFKDEDLARVLQDATAEPAGAFKARGTPAVLRVIEIMGIAASRRWGVCSLNEFRKFLGLKPYDSFTEWNPDPEIATAAMRLYKHPDNLELYVGLQAEQSKPAVDGSNLCCGFTIGRAILSDAICLTRGDRYLTTDWTANNLTAWGFDDASRDPTNPSFGGMIGKLISRNLPGKFPDNSSYLWFPFYTPDSIKKSFTNLGIAGDYTYSRPVALPPIHQVADRENVLKVIQDNVDFRTLYGKKIQVMVGDRSGFFLAFNKPEDYILRQTIHETLVLPSGTYFQDYFYNTTKAVLQELDFTLASHKQKCLDIVEVFSTVVARFVSEEIGGLSLKSQENPDGTHTEHDVKPMLEDMYSYVFVDTEAQHVFRLAKEAKASCETLLEEIKHSYQSANGLGSLLERISGLFYKRHGASYAFMRRLHNTGKQSEQLITAVLAAVVASFEYVPVLVKIVYFYLDPKNVEHYTRLVKLSTSNESYDQATIQGYVREALRLDPLFASTRRSVVKDIAIGGSEFKSGSLVQLDTAHANLDENAFPDPYQINPSRPADSYTLMGDGLHKCFGDEFVQSTLASAIRAVFELKNIRPAPGQSGVLRGFKDPQDPTSEFRFLNSHSVITPFPTSLTLQYDV